MIRIDNVLVKKIAREIANSNDFEGTVCVKVEDIDVLIVYSKYVDGHYEDDYYNGTGAFIVDYVDVEILSVESDNDELVELSESDLILFTIKELAA